MITLLRRIRRSLMESNSTKTYFLYAAGEIVLVVIGILIALQINNWNEDRKNKILEKAILVEINEEFKYNLQEFDNNLIRYAEVRAHLDTLRSLFPIDPKTADLERIAASLSRIHFVGDFDYSSTTIEKLKNTSSFDVLRNEELRSLLLRWEVLTADYVKEENLGLKFNEEQFAPWIHTRVTRPYREGFYDPRVDLSFLGSIEFEGLIRYKRSKVSNLFRPMRSDDNIRTVMERIIELSGGK